MAKRTTTTKSTKRIELAAYAHPGVKRKNNPQVGLVSNATDPIGVEHIYQHDPHIDPYLSWAGKQEGQTFSVPDVSLHVHERIDPQRIVKSFLKEEGKAVQPSLFEVEDNRLPLNQAIDFYFHEQDWANRLIAGDSLLVMNSLLTKEGMAGQVQMIYIDPPYGIKYNSNFQPFTNSNRVIDGNDPDIPAEPEMIQAFRDTWELGIHSYLTYLRTRLLLARDLLAPTGSLFVQINEDNLHYIRTICDEIFGSQNFITIIQFRTASTKPSVLPSSTCDFIVWFAKDKSKVKFREIFIEKTDIPDNAFVDTANHGVITVKGARRLKVQFDSSQIFETQPLVAAAPQSRYEFAYKGRLYNPGNGWRVAQSSLERLAEVGRLVASDKQLRFKRYFSDYPYLKISSTWHDLWAEQNKIYVVQTNTEVVQRCLLMATDPGDLVLDPTCGGGTTAYVAEHWGRRWVTCDTSRVAIALAKQRLMTAQFGYYKLAHPDEGIRSGFVYKKVPHITLGSIANDEPALEEVLYDQPEKVKDVIRTTGPFTLEAVPSLRVKPFDGNVPTVQGVGSILSHTGATGNQAIWRDELKATGIRTVGGKTITFSRVESMKGTTYLHAEAEILEEDGSNKKAVITFGPEYGPMEQRQIEEAINEARLLDPAPDFVIFAAFHFDPEASKDIDQVDWPGVTLLKAQMSVDLLTSDLRKKRSSSQSYWLVGQPDVEVISLGNGQYKVRVNGFDYYDPVSGEIESKDNKHIAMWLLDTDYDERSLLPGQVFFPHPDKNRDWTKLAKALNGEVDEELLEYFVGVESSPFKLGEHRKIAVKIIDSRGIESLVIKRVE